MSAHLLQTRGLSVWAGATCLIPPLDLQVQAGQALCVIGESGAGKSLLVQAIMGLLPPGLQARGEVQVLGHTSLAQHTSGRQALWGRQLALLPQEPTVALDALRTVRAQLDAVHQGVVGLSPRNCQARTQTALQQARLVQASNLHAWQLSGGMAQRAATQLALAGGAQVLLADEPSKGLDPQGTRDLIEHLQQLMAHGGAVLVVTHDLRLAQALPGDTLVMQQGQVVEQGPSLQVLTDPQHAFTRQWLAAAPRHWPRPVVHPTARKADTQTDDTVLRTEDLAVGRGSKVLREGLNLHWPRGALHVIQGPSGCGKSTLGDTLLGLTRPLRGRVLPPLGQKLYQDPVLAFPPLQALRMHLKQVARHHGMPWAQVMQWLQACGVAPHTLDRPAHQVSGGELQRVAMARALCARPAFLFADEPTSRLDPISQQSTCQVLLAATSQQGTACLWVTHDDELAHALTPEPWQWHTVGQAPAVKQHTQV